MLSRYVRELGIMKDRDIIIPDFDKSSFIMPFQMEDTAICDEIIKYYENDVYYKHEGYSIGNDLESGKKSTDVNVFYTCNHPAIVQYRAMLFDFCKTYFSWYEVEMTALRKITSEIKKPMNPARRAAAPPETIS